MAEHPESRTILAPPFYHAMMDIIAFNFSGKTHKKSKVSVKIYVLVIVCIMTGATNILALEGLETADVVQALERHSSRHGIPAVIFVDNGTQLKTLSQATFSLEFADRQVQESMGMRILESNPKSHEERGRVERRIRTIGDTLIKVGTSEHAAMTALQW